MISMPANEDAHDLGRARLDVERQNRIDGGRVESGRRAASLPRTRVAPRLDHRGGFAGIQALFRQRVLQDLSKRFEVARQLRPLNRDLLRAAAHDAIPERAAPFSKSTRSPMSPAFSTATVRSGVTLAERGTGKLASPR